MLLCLTLFWPCSSKMLQTPLVKSGQFCPCSPESQITIYIFIKASQSVQHVKPSVLWPTIRMEKTKKRTKTKQNKRTKKPPYPKKPFYQRKRATKEGSFSQDEQKCNRCYLYLKFTKHTYTSYVQRIKNKHNIKILMICADKCEFHKKNNKTGLRRM